MSRGRAKFDTTELGVVLSYYDLGVIESITEFDRGSSRSPKVGIVSERGKYVLKRRAADRAMPDRVRFAHRVQIHLADAGFPLPKLIPTQDRASTLVQIREHIYELFEFVAGQPFERTSDEARSAGRLLSRFHQSGGNFDVQQKLRSPRGDYHDSPAVRTGLLTIEATLSSHESFAGNESELSDLVQTLLLAYDRAAAAANRFGLQSKEDVIVHLDWHPGNLLFKKGEAIAVLDYDSVRRSKRLLDVANGALQFSMLAGEDPINWPDDLDTDRYAAFLQGYESGLALADDERGCLPNLMAEALVAECVPPITRTGSVGRWAGYRVLQMVRRKVNWLMTHSDGLVRAPAS